MTHPSLALPLLSRSWVKRAASAKRHDVASSSIVIEALRRWTSSRYIRMYIDNPSEKNIRNPWSRSPHPSTLIHFSFDAQLKEKERKEEREGKESFRIDWAPLFTGKLSTNWKLVGSKRLIDSLKKRVSKFMSFEKLIVEFQQFSFLLLIIIIWKWSLYRFQWSYYQQFFPEWFFNIKF